jgi:hypothetical protein
MDAIPGQRFLIDLPPALARRALAIVHRPAGPYSSLSELIVVALENQLELEGLDETVKPQAPPRTQSAPATERAEPRREVRPRRTARGRPGGRQARSTERSLGVDPGLEQLLRRPESAVPTGSSVAEVSGEPLSAFTNRLGPLIAGPRVLVNLTLEAEAPPVDVFVDTAARAARTLGLRLRAEDEAAGRRGRHRRWTAWPVGEDAAKTLVRFRKSFLLRREPGGVTGPLVDLGLVLVSDSRVLPTDAGLELALESTPLLDAGDDQPLSDRQREILAERLLALQGERREITEFLQAIDKTGGAQEEVDKELAREHPTWTEASVVSHRAALIGRLRDLQVIDVSTETGITVIEPGPANAKFRDQLRATTALEDRTVRT